MNPITVTVGPFAAGNAAKIVASNTPAAASALALVGGAPVVLDAPRKVLVTFGVEASKRTILIAGTNLTGNAQTELLSVAAGAGSTVQTEQDFLSVTAVTVFSAWTAAMTVGTVSTGSTAVGSSPWFTLDYHRLPFLVGYRFNITSGPTYQFELTMDDPNAGYTASGNLAPPSTVEPQSNIPPVAFIDPTPTALNGFNGASKTQAFSGALGLPCYAARVSLLTADAASSVQMQLIQAGTFGA